MHIEEKDAKRKIIKDAHTHTHAHSKDVPRKQKKERKKNQQRINYYAPAVSLAVGKAS